MSICIFDFLYPYTTHDLTDEFKSSTSTVGRDFVTINSTYHHRFKFCFILSSGHSFDFTSDLQFDATIREREIEKYDRWG